jgi:arsenate reductase
MKVLFLCTGNTCRSQMAEGLINHDFVGKIEADSAGIEPGVLNPNAIEVMREIGIDISHQRSKHIQELLENEYDLIITLSDYAAKTCPVWPKADEVVHIPFDDPFSKAGSNEEILTEYRRIRDLIRKKVGKFLQGKKQNNI